MAVNTFFEFFFNSLKWDYDRGLRAGGKPAELALSSGKKWLFRAPALFRPITHADVGVIVF